MSRAVKKQAAASEEERAIRRAILAIPSGKVATYGQVAEAAGYPRHHRQVAQILSTCSDALPWHRVLGAGGEIKTALDSALEQRMRLQMEGVRFRGRRVDLARCGFYRSGTIGDPSHPDRET